MQSERGRNNWAAYDCELVLRDDEQELCIAHSFMVAVTPGTCVRMEGRDWIVSEVREREGKRTEVVCSPANQRW